MDLAYLISRSSYYAVWISSCDQAVRYLLTRLDTSIQLSDWAAAHRQTGSMINYLLAQAQAQLQWSELIVEYIRDAGIGGAPALTDAEIFDACYRELVKRWT